MLLVSHHLAKEHLRGHVDQCQRSWQFLNTHHFYHRKYVLTENWGYQMTIGSHFFGIVWSFIYIWLVLHQSLKMIIVKTISTCFVKFSVTENASIHKCLTILAKYVQVYITEPCFLKLWKIFFNTLKSVLTGALFVRVGRSLIFSDLSFWQNMRFSHSLLILTSILLSHFALNFWRRRSSKFEFALSSICRHHLSILYYF